MESLVSRHYNQENLTNQISDALKKSGIKIRSLKTKDLYVIDQLHTGGIKASTTLLDKLDLSPGTRVLDAGCGIGGTSRLLVERFSCDVAGIDLSGQFIDTAKWLTQVMGLTDNPEFYLGSILDMPFGDNSFDAVICQHILMNIKEKNLAAAQFHRVLKMDGCLILHEIVKGSDRSVKFPVPWADTNEISFLTTYDQLAETLIAEGFSIQREEDQSRSAALWWDKVKTASLQKKSPSYLNPSLIFGANASFFGQNMSHNFNSGAIRLMEVVLKKD